MLVIGAHVANVSVLNVNKCPSAFRSDDESSRFADRVRKAMNLIWSSTQVAQGGALLRR